MFSPFEGPPRIALFSHLSNADRKRITGNNSSFVMLGLKSVMEKNQESVTKEFSVPVQALYEAWTDPEMLKQWWTPMGRKLIDLTNELREGGKIEYKFEGQDADNFNITGEYSEVKPEEKLVYSWNWHLPQGTESNYRLTLHFKSTDKGSQLEVLQEDLNDRETVRPKHEGWEKELEHLEQLLASG